MFTYYYYYYYAEIARQQNNKSNPIFHKRKKLIEMAKLARVCYLICIQLKRTQYLQ